MLLAGEDPSVPKLTLKKIRVPHLRTRQSAFLAVLFLLLLDIRFLQRLEALLTPDTHDGYRLLWKILVALKESVSHGENNAVRIIGRFVEALLKLHFFKETDYTTTAECWEVLWRMAPNAMSFYTVSCQKWWECDNVNHGPLRGPLSYGHFDFATRILQLPAGAEWIERDEDGANHGVWKIPCTQDHSDECESHDGADGICGNMPTYRMLTVMDRSDSHFIIRFEDGCGQNLLDRIIQGPIWFNGKPWAVWAGIFKSGSNRSDCYYLVPHRTYHRMNWVRFNSYTGGLKKDPPEVLGVNCVELMFMQPEVTCWCNKFDNWSMRTCKKCKGKAHTACIKEEYEGYRGGKNWKGNGCVHCTKQN